nr:hypothetical protein BaRGS_035223 [Batillaria attramentaria]
MRRYPRGLQRPASTKRLPQNNLGNSSYGRSLMRKDRHHDVKFVDGRDAKAAINSPYFVDLTALEDSGFYEAKLRKKSVTVDLPIQIGIFVYGRRVRRTVTGYQPSHAVKPPTVIR